jgi:hypothetical protein
MHKIQSDSWVIEVAVRDDSWGPCDQKSSYKQLSYFEWYGVMTTWNLEQKVRIIEKMWTKNDKHITW